MTNVDLIFLEFFYLDVQVTVQLNGMETIRLRRIIILILCVEFIKCNIL